MRGDGKGNGQMVRDSIRCALIRRRRARRARRRTDGDSIETRRDHAKMGAEDKKLRDEKAFIEALMGRRPFKNYDAYYCLANARRAGVITMVKKCLAKPIRVARTLALDGRDVTPDEIDTNEGRVLMLEYEKMIVLNTYVPHNGSNAERYEKRALWDFRVQRFLENYRGKKDVVWMGDLNVAHQDHDVGPSPRLFEGVGGFTLPERRRFTDILAATDMVDTYRAFNGDRLTYTWRSTRGQGLDGWQGMRLDYFVVPRKLVARIKSCETSTDRFDDTTAQSMPMSCFMDSDHCMIHLSLHKREDDDDEGENEDEDEEENARRAKQQKLDRDADVILISD